MKDLRFLEAAAKMYGTDKLEHGYLPYYAKHLPDSCRTFLEIGVAKGASALMWDHIYGEDELDLHIADLFINPEFVSARWCRNQGFVPHKGDQTDIHFLYSIKEMFDFIVEDGSHNSYDQIVTFQHLFINNLKSGGIYCVEDLHCCTDPFYRQNLEFEETLLYVFNNYQETRSLESKIFPKADSEVFESLISNIFIYDDKIAFIKKK